LASKQAVLDWEERWSRPAGVAALLAIVLLVASLLVGSQIGGGSGTAEQLQNVDGQTGTQIFSSFLLALGFVLLVAPLYFLFRAARARSNRVRRQLVGVVIAGPLFFAAASVVLGFATVDASERFVENKVPALEKQHVKLDSEKADEKAEDTFSEGSLAGPGVGLKFAGLIGFVAGFLYTALWAMRVGLLTRFWGSLGMALAAVSIFFFQFALLWFVYLGLLLLGFVRGGRPPAWQSGEAEPWPTPGEKAAAQMGKDPDPGLPPPAEDDAQSGSPSEGEPPKKRKRRG
jgi:MFS family permease